MGGGRLTRGVEAQKYTIGREINEGLSAIEAARARNDL